MRSCAARNQVAAAALGRGLVPRGMRVAVGCRHPGSPYLVAAARDLGVPADPEWFLALGDGDALQRGTFHVFAPGAAAPDMGREVRARAG